MKRMLACVCAAVLLTAAFAMPTAASGANEVWVSSYEYARIEAGGKNGTMVYTAYDQNGDYVTGMLTANGEQSRKAFTANAYDALFEEVVLEKTVLGDAAALCPYADTHGEHTVCPYLDVTYATVKNTVTGAVLDAQYMASSAKTTVGDKVHLCWGRYGFESPVTLKWDGESRYMAVKGENGLWAAYDAFAGKTVTDYEFADMSAFEGAYAKVSSGTAWARLDVSGIYALSYDYDSEDAFSVSEELRETADGTYKVFDPDNNAISVAFEGTVTYDSKANLVSKTLADGTTVLYDLQGNEAARFDARDAVTHLQGACYKAERYENGAFVGAALVRVDNVYNPYATYVKGDVNTNGVADSYDARLALRAAAEATVLSEKQEAIADMNGDGAADTADIRVFMLSLLND